MPTIMEQPYPLEFEDQGDRIEVRMEEYDTLRAIHMDAAGVAGKRAAAPSLTGTRSVGGTAARSS